MIVGNSGSGKSTLARQLAEVHSLSTLDLDTIAWETGKIAVARDADDAAADLRGFCDAHEQWVIEGCYGNLARVALERSPVLLFLEPGVDACLANCRNRPWEPHKYASREEQDQKLEFLLAWVAEYYSRTGSLSLADHQALFDGYAGRKDRLAEPDRCFIEAQPLAWFGDDALDLGPRFEACALPAKSVDARRAPDRRALARRADWCEDALVRLRGGISRLNESLVVSTAQLAAITRRSPRPTSRCWRSSSTVVKMGNRLAMS